MKGGGPRAPFKLEAPASIVFMRSNESILSLKRSCLSIEGPLAPWLEKPGIPVVSLVFRITAEVVELVDTHG